MSKATGSKSTSKATPKHSSNELPPRSRVPVADQWDLTQLFPNDGAWEKEFAYWEATYPGYAKFKGTLASGPQAIAAVLRFDAELERRVEKVGNYANLRSSGDNAEPAAQRMKGRFSLLAAKHNEAASFIRPELLAIPEAKMNKFMKAPELAEWKLALERIVRYRPHTLTLNEEKILALSANMAGGPSEVFRQLNDTDMAWPTVEDETGRPTQLGHSAYSRLLHSRKRSVRKAAFHAYYTEYEAHKHTLAASYNAAVQGDVFFAKARNYPSARDVSLFADNVPAAVYDSLIAAVHKHLPTNHRYLALRKKALKLDAVHMYDVYAPMVPGVKTHYTWEQAANTVADALAPLGTQYTNALREGLTTGRWSDRYPNKNKSSGAFSSGGFDGPPYIMMNYQPEVLDHTFTLAHEAGHSMHTWLSARNQPYQYYGYTIFVAEVASTFNEQLLLKHLLDRAKSNREKAHLINHAIDEIRNTIVRQTMFAEFEKISHELVEKGEPLTVELLRGEYRKLLELYFGVAPGSKEKPGKVSKFVIDPELELEGMRIPHFYHSFYVYKYATGLSAAIALSEGVLNGGERELNDYLNFLKGGCSKWPLDLLRDAGVDMEKPAPVETALKRYGELVDQLEELL